MAGFEEEEEKPLDPSVERVRRKLVRFVGINLGLLFLALLAVVGALVYKGMREPAPATPVAGPEVPSPAEGTELSGEIALPAGARLVSQSLSGGRIALEIETQAGARSILIYDIGQRRIIGRFAIVSR